MKSVEDLDVFKLAHHLALETCVFLSHFHSSFSLPTEVRLSRADDNVRLFYEFYAQTRVGGKWLCVVVKYLPDDAFVVTAYLTETIKAGETLWPRK